MGDLLVTTEDEETNQRHDEKRVVFQSVARGYRSTLGKRQIYHVLLNTSMLEGEQEDDLEIMSEMYLKDGPLDIKNDIMMLSIGSSTISLVILDVVCKEEEWQYCFREGDGYRDVQNSKLRKIPRARVKAPGSIFYLLLHHHNGSKY